MIEKTPKSFGDARRMNDDAVEELRQVAAGKHAAARLSPWRDTSALNAARAIAAGWRRTGWLGWLLPSETTHR